LLTWATSLDVGLSLYTRPES